MNIAEFLAIPNSICPDREAVVYEGATWTYAQLHDRVRQLSAGLARLGVGKGDRVAMIQVNCPQTLELCMALATRGATLVPLNFRARADEFAYLLNDSKPRCLFAGIRYLPMAIELRSRMPQLGEIVSMDQRSAGTAFYDDLLVPAEDESTQTEVDDKDVAVLLYTSGTTGTPKGVQLSHGAFSSYVLANVEPPIPGVTHSILMALPLHHVAGIQTVLASFFGGRTIVLMAQFEPGEWLRTAQTHRVNRALLVPTMLKALIDYPTFSHFDLSSLQVITYGAASMPLETITRAIELMPWVKFFNAFGQTETASSIAVLGPEDHVLRGTPAEVDKKLKRLASSIGKPLPGVEIRIVADGKTLPPFTIGEIAVKSAQVMSGYWGGAEKPVTLFTPDGWLLTRDTGWMDDEGYVYLAGRADDVIKRGGEMISPEEVENVLSSHPAVKDAAVIGVPDMEWGHQPRALVVLKNGASATQEELIEYCHVRLAGFKRPRSVIFVDSIPRNQLGKPLRKQLREHYGRP